MKSATDGVLILLLLTILFFSEQSFFVFFFLLPFFHFFPSFDFKNLGIEITEHVTINGLEVQLYWHNCF